MPTVAVRRFVACLLLTTPMPMFADAFAPLPTYNQNPFAQIFGLPAFDAPRLIAPGQWQTRISLEAANHFFSRDTGAEFIRIDGETHRAALTFKYGTARAEWGIEVPYLSHSGGFLDGFIDNWHDAFGLPDGGREGATKNQINYVYARNGEDLIRISDRADGLGDVRLLAAWALATGDYLQSAVRASLKLPTGDADRLHGSGAPDLSVWLSAGGAPANAGRWRWNATAGVIALGRGDVIAGQQRQLAAFGGVGGGWRAWNPVILKAELRTHTAFYRNTDLEPLGRTATQLILGGTWNVTKETALDIAVSEDIRVHTAPDVSILISLRSNFVR